MTSTATNAPRDAGIDPTEHDAPRAADLELLRNYDVPVPRYTSYPTAPQFEEMGERDVLGGFDDEAADGPISLYFHIPYCQKLCWYCACNRIISKDHGDGDSYIDTLLREVDGRLPYLEGRPVTQVHLGGGTPTFLTPGQLRRLGRDLQERFEFTDNAEIALEIDPRACTEAHVQALDDVGFNRASMGVQDHNPEVQEAINRHQPFEMTRRVVEWLRDADFESVNFDCVYGLPHQTEASFRRTLDDLMELKPDRLAVYSYAHVPWKHPAQKLLEDEGLPDAETKLQLLKCAIERLTDAGYVYIGLDHFARPDDSLTRALEDRTLRRNFQGYSTFGGTDVHAFGMSGISQTRTMYVQNHKELEPYREAVENDELPVARGCRLSRDDRIRRATIEEVMCRRRLRFEDISRRFEIDFADYFADELAGLAPLEDDGLLVVRDDAIEMTPRGRLVLRNIASRFDAYLDTDRGRFSQTV